MHMGTRYVCMYVCMHACMYVCMHACMYVCMYVCMHVCVYIYIYICTYTQLWYLPEDHNDHKATLTLIVGGPDLGSAWLSRVSLSRALQPQASRCIRVLGASGFEGAAAVIFEVLLLYYTVSACTNVEFTNPSQIGGLFYPKSLGIC